MTVLSINIPASLYQQLQQAAKQQKLPVETIAQNWLTAYSLESFQENVEATEHVQASMALRAAGLLTELSPAEKVRAAQPSLTLEEARAILDREGSKPLSELILEMRGPKA